VGALLSLANVKSRLKVSRYLFRVQREAQVVPQKTLTANSFGRDKGLRIKGERRSEDEKLLCNATISVERAKRGDGAVVVKGLFKRKRIGVWSKLSTGAMRKSGSSVAKKNGQRDQTS